MPLPNIQIVPASRTANRVVRTPQHRFTLRTEPYQIQPFCIAPVLPHETLKRGSVKARAVTDPIKNAVMGWWKEYYVFYVKLRDLAGRDDFVEMLMDMDKDMSSYYSASSLPYYHESAVTPDAINWTKLCLQRIVEEWFRDENETWDTETIGGMPIAQLKQPHWLDSVVNDATYASMDQPTDDTGATAGEIERAQATWSFMRTSGMTEMSYEDFIGTFGVRAHKEEPHKPELIRYFRDWTYPTNHIDPTDGSPTSACSWAVSFGIDKDRYFKEHGFIMGVTVARPKVYFRNQIGAAVSMLDNALAWMPAIMRDAPYTSMKKMTSGTGPLSGVTDDYWVDLRDIFIHGDQFVNFDLSELDANMVNTPTAALEKHYINEAQLDALFVSALSNNIDEDGVITLNILGAEEDMTPKTAG